MIIFSVLFPYLLPSSSRAKFLDGLCVFVAQEKGYSHWSLFHMSFLSWKISAFLLAAVMKFLLFLYRKVMSFLPEASDKPLYCPRSGQSNNILTLIQPCTSPDVACYSYTCPPLKPSHFLQRISILVGGLQLLNKYKCFVLFGLFFKKIISLYYLSAYLSWGSQPIRSITFICQIEDRESIEQSLFLESSLKSRKEKR